ncbi:MAG: helix-turn-helix domain-containing protein [Acidobacteriaceae bacterium]|nr:helix-turn-helix domain-containing protein [Acidobacteriaceae bacterium]
MTPTDLRTTRAALGYTQGGLATALGVGRRTVQQWEAGDRSVPEPIARILRLAIADPTILPRLAAS